MKMVSTPARDDIEALANWDAKAEPSQEIAFTPAACANAGFHRSARYRGFGGHARGDGKISVATPHKINPIIAGGVSD